MTTPIFSDGEVFFEPNTSIDNLADYHHVWPDKEAHPHSKLAQHAPLRASSLEEQSQDLLSFWPYQETDISKASMPPDRQTLLPSESNNSELAVWLNSFLG